MMTTDQTQSRLEATVYGRVQGVSFRYYTRQTAVRLGLGGWVANHQDGTVRVVAEGPQAALDELVLFLQDGPPAARVDHIDLSWSATTGDFSQFQVTRL